MQTQRSVTMGRPRRYSSAATFRTWNSQTSNGSGRPKAYRACVAWFADLARLGRASIAPPVVDAAPHVPHLTRRCTTSTSSPTCCTSMAMTCETLSYQLADVSANPIVADQRRHSREKQMRANDAGRIHILNANDDRRGRGQSVPRPVLRPALC